MGTILLAQLLLAPGRASLRHLGHDFLPFYTAGTFVREGRSGALYELDAIRAFEHELARAEGLELGDAVGPFWNPPLYALHFAPLSALPYRAAWAVWIVLNLMALGVAVALLCRALGTPDWRTWGLVPFGVLLSTPFLLALTHGQNTFTSLLLLALVTLAWRGRRPLLAGAVLGLLAYKPQLTAVVAAVLILDLGWRAAAGVALAGVALLGLTLLTLPGSLGNYLHNLPGLLHYMQVENPYIWERHATIKAFWRLLLQGAATGETGAAAHAATALCTAALALALLAAALRGRTSRAAAGRDRLIAATVAATPLVMPFYFDYDLLLLAVPAVLVARERLGRAAKIPVPRADRALVAAGCALFAWLMVNPDVAELTRINLAVPLLGIVATLLIARAWAGEVEVSVLPAQPGLPLTRAA